jgi:hypothetical protein
MVDFNSRQSVHRRLGGHWHIYVDMSITSPAWTEGATGEMWASLRIAKLSSVALRKNAAGFRLLESRYACDTPRSFAVRQTTMFKAEKR